MPIIVISARSEDTDKIEALDAGADDYITKPFSVEELLARICVTQRRLAITQTGEQNETSVFENGGLKIDYTASCTPVRNRSNNDFFDGRSSSYFLFSQPLNMPPFNIDTIIK